MRGIADLRVRSLQVWRLFFYLLCGQAKAYGSRSVDGRRPAMGINEARAAGGARTPGVSVNGDTVLPELRYAAGRRVNCRTIPKISLLCDTERDCGQAFA